MNEIRFNSFEPKPALKEEGAQKKEGSGFSAILSKIKKILKIIVVLMVMVAIIFGGIYLYNKYFSKVSSGGVYSAVFLSNGQVYFGKIEENNSKEIILNNVFYLQNSDNSGTAGQSIQGSKFTLIKLGNELHGPTDELFINKQNVLFYEYLRTDSQVVQSIKNYKL